MEFIIFGSGSGLPVLDKGLSSIYVEHQGKKLLLIVERAAAIIY